jgi:holo-[acyl-carrier protein] synthase
MRHIGIDMIEIARIEGAIARWGDNFLQRIYTESELKLYQQKPSSLAARFAGKEAVIKTLSPQGKGINWREIEILSEPNGRPSIHLYGKARNQAKSLGVDKLAISLSHCKDYAIALVTAETK